MSGFPISEAATVQFPMVEHAREIGWEPLPPEEAERRRGGVDGMLFREDIEAKIREFNPWLSGDTPRQMVEKLAAIPATIEGNREMLSWMRGERQWYDETARRHQRVQLIDFDEPDANTFHVSWEWRIKPPARKGNRADLMFVINGIPVAIVEHKNPKDDEAIEHGIAQLRRYQEETPELMRTPQLFNVTHLLEYWYGATWNISRRYMAQWKEQPDESYKFAVQSFFDRVAFLRTLRDWILFYEEGGETRKSVLRQHQRRAVERIVSRCSESEKPRGLIWHTQGAGKTFTLLTAARLILEQKDQFRSPTVILVVDRTELEGQLDGWMQRLFGETQQTDIPIARANSKAKLQRLLESDWRGLILSTIHKFDGMPEAVNTRDNIYVFIDEAHRSVARDLGNCLMAAAPKATIIGFTGTPVGGADQGKGTFKIFSGDDEAGYLDKYSIAESIADETTLPIRYSMAPSEMTVPAEQLEKEFFASAQQEDVTDWEELERVLRRAANLRTFLTADDRVEKVAEFVTRHFRENVEPTGGKAMLVGVSREACAMYKRALDKRLSPEWSAAVYAKDDNDATEHPLVAEFQLTEEEEKNVRNRFRKENEDLKILIVTNKLLTGYDAPLLYCMYLDKPMQNHVLLQAIARVNRPYIFSDGARKSTGLVIDFVGVLRDLNRALQFDSADVRGAIEDLNVLMQDFRTKIVKAQADYLGVEETGAPDEKFEKIVYRRLKDREQRQLFFKQYKEIERLWEILSPTPELREHQETYQQLAGVYAAVRSAYGYHGRPNFSSELARKTSQLVRGSAVFEGLDRLVKFVTFDANTVRALRDAPGLYEPKVFNLLRGLDKELQGDADLAVALPSLRKCAERIRHDLEERKIDAQQALEQLELLAVEKDAALASEQHREFSSRAFSVYWNMKDVPELKAAGIDAKELVQTTEELLQRYPDAAVHPEQKRRLRSALYVSFQALEPEIQLRMVEEALGLLLDERDDAQE